MGKRKMKKILIIDDDRDLSMIISDMLESYGFAVTCVETAEQAFASLEKNLYHGNQKYEGKTQNIQLFLLYLHYNNYIN